ncbi:MAG: N-formylglutamate amidohydrolase [Novosphingobium sp.]|uniref:N-formylglutamate amidohydrolase n=1 Tax=Novosphingobium sp. TaxID=1874826 RepID=UPI0032BDDFF1
MEHEVLNWNDSQRKTGGIIPGSGGLPAFSLVAPQPSAIPILIAVPHAGRAYPGTLLERMRNPGFAALKLEDRYADRLAERVARQTGAALLVANAPRAMIDLNRGSDEIDWDMFARGAPDSGANPKPGIRVRSGLGLIPRRLQGLGELWKRRHDEADLAARIEQIHAPYHACLAETLATLRMRWGAALLLDLHSMPPLGFRGGQAGPDFVLGDRFGASCSGTLVGSCFSYFAQHRCGAAHNRPYAGGYVLNRHADPAAGIHALQLEIDRSNYLDARLAEPGAGFDAMVDLLIGLVRRMAGEVADLGRLGRPESWVSAAE